MMIKLFCVIFGLTLFWSSHCPPEAVQNQAEHSGSMVRPPNQSRPKLMAQLLFVSIDFGTYRHFWLCEHEHVDLFIVVFIIICEFEP